MSLIHGQICLASFFKWKSEQRDKQVAAACVSFKNAMMIDFKAEARREALASLPEESPAALLRRSHLRRNMLNKTADLSSRNNLGVSPSGSSIASPVGFKSKLALKRSD